MTEGPSVAVLASANFDLVGTAPTLPRPGETVLGERFSTNPGGKGLNQAIAIARLGGACTAIAAVGDDSFGTELLAGLQADGVDTHLVRVAPGPSGVALIAVDAAGENQILVAPGANATLTALTDGELAAVRSAQALLCQLELPIEAVEQAVAAAHQAGVPVILNAAPARALPAELLAMVDILVVNRGEAETLCGALTMRNGAAAAGDPVAGGAMAVPDAAVAADDAFLAGGPRRAGDAFLEGSAPLAGSAELAERLAAVVPSVAITLGPDGVVFRGAGTNLHVPAPVVSAVDATAAGDAFAGALTVAWLEGRPIAEALQWACAAGAACAQALGASASLPDRATVDRLWATTYR